MTKLNIDSIKREKRTDCFICGDPLPLQPWHAFAILEGQQVARPQCDECFSAKSDQPMLKAEEPV